jgi:RNA polymerase sigma-70 factor (ECF subfamily)
LEEVNLLYRRALELMVRDFEPKTWKAFWGVVVEGRRAAEVAADLGMTENAVYLAKARVLARLREEFQDLIDQ